MIKDSEFVRIAGYEDYGVNKKGDVYSFKTNKIMRQGKNRKGYSQVCLTVDSKKHTKRIHRLVAETFIKKVYGKNQVNHKDGNKANNNVENLEWCDNSENQIHAYRVLKKENHGGGGGKVKVRCVETGEIFNSLSDAGREKNVYTTNITRACRTNIATGGYHWEYVKGGRCYGN